MFNQSKYPLCHSLITPFLGQSSCTENTCEFRHNCSFYKITNKDKDTLTFAGNNTIDKAIQQLQSLKVWK